jgi:hypothetical protein
VAGDDGEHAAPGRLARADPRGAVLQHEHLVVFPVPAADPETLPS